MATNSITIEGLQRMNELVDELTAWNKLLKRHVVRQKGLKPTQHRHAIYVYDERTKKLCIVNTRTGKVKAYKK
jgi:hypothetical protein